MLKDVAGIFGAIMPFLFATVVVLGVLYFRYMRRLETEKTIRLAIEQGQQLDAQLIEKMMEPQQKPHHAPEKLRVGGTITLFVGIGLTVMGLIVDGLDPDERGLLAAGALIATIGVGIVVASRFAKPNT